MAITVTLITPVSTIIVTITFLIAVKTATIRAFKPSGVAGFARGRSHIHVHIKGFSPQSVENVANWFKVLSREMSVIVN